MDSWIRGSGDGQKQEQVWEQRGLSGPGAMTLQRPLPVASLSSGKRQPLPIPHPHRVWPASASPHLCAHPSLSALQPDSGSVGSLRTSILSIPGAFPDAALGPNPNPNPVLLSLLPPFSS